MQNPPNTCFTAEVIHIIKALTPPVFGDNLKSYPQKIYIFTLQDAKMGDSKGLRTLRRYFGLIFSHLSYIRRYIHVSPSKKYKQLRFSLESTGQHYHYLPLRFRLRGQLVEGILHGDCSDWCFTSQSPVFIKIVPCGKLRKYMLWIDGVPENVGVLYNAISEAAGLAGYTMQDRDEVL